MRKFLSITMSLMCLFLLCGCEWLGFFSKEKNLKEIASEHLSVSLETATVLEEWDTHGGFHGDGVTFVKLSCVDGFEEKLIKTWKPLPLEGEIYKYFYEWGGLFEHPETGARVIPEVENGYWYFKNTGAMNWDFALYDCDKNILYFYEWDA